MPYRIVQFKPGIFWKRASPAPPPVEPINTDIPKIRSVGMAISTIGSYPPTMEQFIAHWTEVNAALAPGALTLKGGFTLANFTTERTNIVTAIDAVVTADNGR